MLTGMKLACIVAIAFRFFQEFVYMHSNLNYIVLGAKLKLTLNLLTVDKIVFTFVSCEICMAVCIENALVDCSQFLD